MSNPEQPTEGPDPTQPSGTQPPATPPGQPQYGQPPYGQPPHGGPQGEPPYPPQGHPGQPQYGQPPQGQPPYGQPQYGQPQYGQPQYGQPSYGQPQAPQFGAALSGPMNPTQERFLASASHWGALIAGIFTSGSLAWLVPLAVLMLKGKESPVVRRQAVESLNFQISMLIYGAIVLVLALVTLGVGLLLFLPLAVWWLVAVVLAAVKVNNGEDHRYAAIFRFVT
ncbi:DUF4870 domain-containing protein [Nocardioides daphniae]|uniref:DUF4870 domain-containing protein n=1 Tax=Nocardioides daphniae TaxID=402297 RepID=A0A4P7UDN3_9ACTN|nr:DUF4870 domain-containing protein [Nocardioides daphniae]QCC77661.1 DUF4870 domain-containing protein [Nocardioides daphniae]GGD29700.1 hypothetical protein GCM10007231_31480 [Nocardioides daphniae]